MTLAFADRPPNLLEIERLRLILSAYQDGTGMLALRNGTTLPGWRDFERAVALAFQGEAAESKAIFDVLITGSANSVQYGLSCKMRKELNRIGRDGRVTVELSNSASQFWDALALKGITVSNYRDSPQEVGITLLELVKRWHQSVSIEHGGEIDLSRSYYFILSWSDAGWYQLHQFSLLLPDPQTLRWYFPDKQVKGESSPARRINGNDTAGTVLEWYGESGGQLKYYPMAESALWHSEPFRLEPMPEIKYGLATKVAAYFPEQWAKTLEIP